MFRYNKYWSKLLIYGACMSIFPILVLGLLFYFKASNSIQQKVNEGNEHILEQTRLRVEQILQTVDRSMDRIADNKAITQALGEDLTPSKFQMIQELFQAIYRSQTFDSGVQDVHLINLQNDWILNNSGLQRLSELPAKDRIDGYLRVKGNTFWTSEGTSLSKYNNFSERVIILVKKIPAFSEHPKGLLIAEIPSRLLSSLIHKNNSFGEIVFFDTSYRMLARQNESFTDENGAELEKFVRQVQAASGDGQPAGEALLNGYTVGTLLKMSDYNHWLYLSIIPLDQIYSESREVGWIVLFSCLVLMAFLLILKGSRLLYVPIQSLYESLQPTRDRRRTVREDEFDVISQNISGMYQTQLRLSEQIRGQHHELQELFVLKLIHGELPADDIEEKLSIVLHKPEAPVTALAVLVTQIDTLADTRFDDKDHELLLFAVNNMVGDIVSHKQRLMPLVVNHSQVTVMYSKEEAAESFKAFAALMAERIQLEVGRYLGVPISIGVSRVYSSLRQAPLAYREGEEALKYRLLSGHNTILPYDEIKYAGVEEPHFPAEIERRLLQAVKYADVESIEPLLDEFFSEITRRSASYTEYQISFIRFFVDLLRLLEETGIPLRSVHDYELPPIEKILACKTRDDIQWWFKRSIVDPLIPVFEQQRRTKQNTISQEAIRMIREEFDTDLTLELCASRLNYHPSHVSRVLKTDTGVSFSEYLSQYRLEMAKTLLINSDATVTEIAEKLRYHNPQNFIRYFRKMVGMTPGQFREKHE